MCKNRFLFFLFFYFKEKQFLRCSSPIIFLPSFLCAPLILFYFLWIIIVSWLSFFFFCFILFLFYIFLSLTHFLLLFFSSFVSSNFFRVVEKGGKAPYASPWFFWKSVDVVIPLFSSILGKRKKKRKHTRKKPNAGSRKKSPYYLFCFWFDALFSRMFAKGKTLLLRNPSIWKIQSVVSFITKTYTTQKYFFITFYLT